MPEESILSRTPAQSRSPSVSRVPSLSESRVPSPSGFRVSRSPSPSLRDGSLPETVDLTEGLDSAFAMEEELWEQMSTGGGMPSSNPKKLIAQPSTIWTRRQNAVCVRRARKTYGSKSNQHVILDNLNMTVPKGCIYGLLGASGCGKTTLLSCIVGRKRLNSGEIWVLGGHPGTRGSGVPGPRIGYMPQEMALYGEFTIRETLLYFGWVAGMTTEKIEERTAFLLNLLQLPGPERYVKDLSGGQQRRVSMAATFLHEPELLILDEPTVGVDPIIRQSVWNYLVEITADKSTTIIITTHYIDETKQATTIGLMRGGRFLAEESPAELLQRYNSDSLEDAFLKLSILQNKGKRRRSSISSDIVAAQATKLPELNMGNVNDAFDNKSEISGEFGDNMSIASTPAVITPQHSDPLPPNEEVDFSWKDVLTSVWAPHHMKALIWKNFLWMFRNVGVMLYIIGMPIIETCLFCWAIGKYPTGLHIGVVNHEVPFQGLCTYNTSCSYERLSCRYLDHFSKRNQTIIPYSSIEEATNAVEKGKAWGYIEFPLGFSEMLTTRLEMGKDANDSVLLGSEIDVRLDMSNHQILFMLQRDFYLALEAMANEITKVCQIPDGVLSLPVALKDPVYGPRIPNFTDFAAPGVILTIVFFLAVALTSGTMLIERNEGILERCLVSGITGLEILSSHVVTQFLVVFCQAIMVILFTLVIFDITNNGSFFWILVMITLCGTCGMAYGFFVSCICDSERSATYFAMGSFLPFVMLCGIIWPVEGMNWTLQFISKFLPLTMSTESLRFMLARGWGMDQYAVYTGFISITFWLAFYMLISVLLLKFKKG